MESKIDIVSVSETWFQPGICDEFYNWKGFKLFRADRIFSSGGDAALYVRDGLNCKFICNSGDDCPLEYVFVSIRCNTESVLVGSVYRPYSHISVANLVTTLESVSSCYSYILLCGDFNCNLLNKRLSENFIDIFKALNLSPVNNSTPPLLTLPKIQALF